MILEQEFILRNFAGETVLIPLANKNDTFDGIISLNETSEFIWKQIENGKEHDEIVESLLNEYEVDKEKASQDVNAFCDKLRKLGILE